MPVRVVVHGRNLLLLGVFILLGLSPLVLKDLTFSGPIMALIILAHFFLLPGLAKKRSPEFERQLLIGLQAKQPTEVLRRFQRAWLIRLYAPSWYISAKEALIRQDLQEVTEAEWLLDEALQEAPDQERGALLANQVRVKRKLGKQEEAARLLSQLRRERPDLANLLEDEERPGA